MPYSYPKYIAVAPLRDSRSHDVVPDDFDPGGYVFPSTFLPESKKHPQKMTNKVPHHWYPITRPTTKFSCLTVELGTMNIYDINLLGIPPTWNNIKHNGIFLDTVVHLSIRSSVRLSIRLSVSPSICPFHPSFRSSIHSSIRLVHSSVRPMN